MPGCYLIWSTRGRAHQSSQMVPQDIRDAAQAGMQGKARQFREKGGEIYLAEVPSP